MGFTKLGATHPLLRMNMRRIVGKKGVSEQRNVTQLLSEIGPDTNGKSVTVNRPAQTNWTSRGKRLNILYTVS